MMKGYLLARWLLPWQLLCLSLSILVSDRLGLRTLLFSGRAVAMALFRSPCGLGEHCFISGLWTAAQVVFTNQEHQQRLARHLPFHARRPYWSVHEDRS